MGIDIRTSSSHRPTSCGRSHEQSRGHRIPYERIRPRA
ncbi:hypothetical protein JK196_05770 [Gluconobacter albidus]|nr:hypothetical protein [Gluconobacter albidus]